MLQVKYFEHKTPSWQSSNYKATNVRKSPIQTILLVSMYKYLNHMKLISKFISGRVFVNRKRNLQIKIVVSSVNNGKLCLPKKSLFFVSLHTFMYTAGDHLFILFLVMIYFVVVRGNFQWALTALFTKPALRFPAVPWFDWYNSWKSVKPWIGEQVSEGHSCRQYLLPLFSFSFSCSFQ